MLAIHQTTNLPVDRFPEYIDPFELSGLPIMSTPAENPAQKLLAQVKDEPSRHPSPQPTHLGVPHMARLNGNGHRILRSATVGYVAPEFGGRLEQMEEGML